MAAPRRMPAGAMRALCVRLHRYAGLGCALFLIVAGLTGSLLAFGEDLDVALNAHLFQAPGRGQPLGLDVLVERVEAADPRIEVEYLSMPREIGRSAFAFTVPRDGLQDAKPAFDQVFIDPVTGLVLGQRQRGACCLEREHLYYFVLNVHHSLFLPGLWGWWFMGGVALVWLLDHLVALLLTLPFRRPLLRKWWQAWRIKPGGSVFRINFDIHRAGGLWLWPLTAVLALSSVALNLKNEVFKPVVSRLSPLTSTPVERPRAPFVGRSVLSFEAVRQRADAHALSRGWNARVSGVSYFRSSGIYLALLWPSHHDRGLGLGQPIVYFDAASGQMLGELVPGQGTAGDTVLQAQFPLHSGQVGGLAGRVVVSALGVALAVLAGTGTVIWWRKRAGRRAAAERMPPTRKL